LDDDDRIHRNDGSPGELASGSLTNHDQRARAWVIEPDVGSLDRHGALADVCA